MTAAVNIADVQLIINEALGLSSCTADLNGDGKCDIVDVQRVITAALGGNCSANVHLETFTYYVDIRQWLRLQSWHASITLEDNREGQSTTSSRTNRSGSSAGGCGGRWLQPGQSGRRAVAITFAAYGSGAKPVINGADVFTSWTQGSSITGHVSRANMPRVSLPEPPLSISILRGSWHPILGTR